MADRYEKDDLLVIPSLQPERHYESQGKKENGSFYLVPTAPNRFFQTIDDLDGVYDMASLLPPELGDIIRRITNVLSVDTQGKMILKIEKDKEDNTDDNDNKTDENTDYNDNITPYNPSGETSDDDDIFSDKPAYKIQVVPSTSLVKVAQAAYEQDDLDIKDYYTSRMTDISSRFFQIMTTLAAEAGMPDYSYLMQDFDGTAVTTDDPNQTHLIDMICKDQIIYDQKLRQMNLTHTARNTLIMTRGLTAAEGQRERYLGERYKENLPDTASSLSNDMLQRSREQADQKYKDAAYNLYKYLDGAVKSTNTLLNLKIDEAAAKTQLSNTGSDIYAYTPPTPATENHIDDNFDTSVKAEDKGQKFVDEQKKDSVTGKEASSGGASADGGSGGGGSFTSVAGELGGGNVDPKSVWDILKKAGYTDIANAAILGYINQECRFNSHPTGNPNHQGLCQWGDGVDGDRWGSLVSWAQSQNKDPYDGGTQIDYMLKECTENDYYAPHCSTSGTVNQATTIEDAEMIWLTWFGGAPDQEYNERVGFAHEFYNQFSGK